MWFSILFHEFRSGRFLFGLDAPVRVMCLSALVVACACVRAPVRVPAAGKCVVCAVSVFLPFGVVPRVSCDFDGNQGRCSL